MDNYLNNGYLFNPNLSTDDKDSFLGNKGNSYSNNNNISKNLNHQNNLNVINNNSFKNDENKNKVFIKKKLHYFNIIKSIKKRELYFNNKEFLNNEQKIIKYNKIVYINKFLIKEKRNKKLKDLKNKRSSKYRGVSKNGIGWQVLMMFNKNKSYVGTFYSEKLAARIYDIVSIKRIGINAKTNFLYNNKQISRILEANIDFKSPNISKIISELIH